MIDSLYHSCMVTDWGQISDRRFLSARCNDRLNSTMSRNPSYPASRAAFSKSWTCLSAVLSPCIIVLIFKDMVVHLSVSLNHRWTFWRSLFAVLYHKVFLNIWAMMYLHQAQAEPVCMWDRIQVTLFCSVLNSDGHPLIYKIHKWMKVSVSFRLLEKGRGDVVFRSLNEDQARGVWGKGTCDDEKHGGVGSGREPNGHGGECWDKSCKASVFAHTLCIR